GSHSSHQRKIPAGVSGYHGPRVVGGQVNWLDAGLILLIAFSIWRSFAKGLTREVIGLLSVVVGIFAGTWLYSAAGSYIEPHVSSRGVANFCGFVLVFVGVMLLGSLIGFILSKLLRVTGLSFFD